MAGSKEFLTLNLKPILNANYKHDINYSFELNRWLMRPVGIWPRTPETTWHEILLSRILNVIYATVFLFLLISTLLYIIIDERDIHMKLMKLGPAIYLVTTLMKYWLVISNETDIRRCVDHMEVDWKDVKRQEDRQIMLESAHIGRRIIATSASIGIATTILYRVVVPLNSPKVVVGNLSYRPLALPMSKIILDVRQSPTNEIMILVQCIAGIIMSAVTVGSCSMIAVCALHARGQLKIIMYWLNHVVNGWPGENDTIDNRLSAIVIKHVRVLNFIACSEDTMYGVSFSEVMVSTVNMCIVAYAMIRGWNHVNTIKMFTYITLMTYFVSNIFIICYIGELLAEENQKMAEATYMIDWYEIKGKKAISLVLIHSMSLSTTKLTAGKIIELSITSFGDFENQSGASAEASGDLLKQETYTSSTNRTSVMDTPSSILQNPSINKNYEKDLNYSIEFTRWLLNPLGVWPGLNKNNRLNKYFVRFKNMFCYGVIFLLITVCSIYSFTELHDFKSRLKMSGSISFFIMAFIKYSSLLIRKKYIKRGISYISKDWKNVQYHEDRQIMIDYAAFGRKLVIISAVFMFGGTSFYRVVVPISTKIVADNITYRRLAYPIPRIMFDARHSPVNELMIIIQGLLGMVVNTITVGACGIAAVFVMHACGQLEVLMSWLRYLVDGRTNKREYSKDRLAAIVKKHVQVLNFASLTEDLLNEISLVEVLGCTLNLCLLGYHCLNEGAADPLHAITFAIMLVSFGFNIFIFCYIGELLTEQCKKVGQASYMIDWYKLPKSESLGLLLIISMSASSGRFSAGKFIELSLYSFGDVIKASVTYLNMLRTVTSQTS